MDPVAFIRDETRPPQIKREVSAQKEGRTFFLRGGFLFLRTARQNVETQEVLKQEFEMFVHPNGHLVPISLSPTVNASFQRQIISEDGGQQRAEHVHLYGSKPGWRRATEKDIATVRDRAIANGELQRKQRAAMNPLEAQKEQARIIAEAFRDIMGDDASLNARALKMAQEMVASGKVTAPTTPAPRDNHDTQPQHDNKGGKKS